MTVAYSNKYNAWTTRYSFEPTCYAKVDNSFVSSKSGGENYGVWEHDVSNSRCNFYGVQEGSKLEVVANQDPSAVKMFKAISLETNERDWTAEVFTNDDYSGNEKQQSEIEAFISKEGYQYAEMPRSTINSSSNVFTYKGGAQTVFLASDSSSIQITETLSSDGGFVDLITWHFSEGVKNLVAPINDFRTNINAETGLDNDGNPLNPFVGLPENHFPAVVRFTKGIEDMPVSRKLRVRIYTTGLGFPNDFFSTDFLDPAYNTTSAAVGPVSALNPVFIPMYLHSALNSKDHVVIMDLSQTADEDGNLIESDDPIIVALQDSAQNLNGSVKGDVVAARIAQKILAPFRKAIFTSPSVNGDTMRGPYLRASIETTTEEPLELHAVNVDYEFSKLDARLTQNT